MTLRVFAVTFTKYPGEHPIFLAHNFDELVEIAQRWGRNHGYGTDIQEIEHYGTVDAMPAVKVKKSE